MAQLRITGRDGTRKNIVADDRLTLMEAIREAGFDELQAMCGGSCSCATCHVYLESEGFGDASDDEDELLDGSDYRTPASRLSCQVRLGQGSASISVTIAPED